MTVDPFVLQDEIIRRMSVAEKFRISATLRQTAWDLKTAWLRQQHPEWSEPEVQEHVRQIFLHATG